VALLKEAQKTIFFDFDGTLCDTGKSVMESLYATLNEEQIPIPSGLTAEEIMGPPVTQTFAKFFPTLSQEDIESCYKKFKQLYSSAGKLNCNFYDGVSELLDVLAPSYNLAILSNKDPESIKDILIHFKLIGSFKIICGGEVGKSSAPTKSDRLRMLMTDYNLKSEDCIIVGDRYIDINAAVDNSCTPIGVSWGFGKREELLQAGAVHIAKDTTELLAIIHSLN
jgi:phosphoglycolate phosphatase